MALEEIRQKRTVIDTPRASDLAARPDEWENRFQFHVSTHVTLADMTDKWDAILKNLLQGRSATGLIHADTGYGKTSTAAALWHYAEKRDVVTVPPFAWNSIADMLIATHGWVCHRLKVTRPDLISDLDQEYKTLIASSNEDRALRISQEEEVPLDYARKSVQSLKARGDLTDEVSANRLIDYLLKATSTVLEADYKGLLILPDEFELFANTNPDIAKNFSELKDFIFSLYQEENLPVGCVVLTYRRTFSTIQNREPHIVARFNQPPGSSTDLEQEYGKIENGKSFAHELWEKLSITCDLSNEEQNAIDPDVLFALGQFLGHQRTTQLISGPRSVVATLQRAAIHYTETQQPYSIFDFCKDYISQGIICFNNQEIDAVKAYTSIMSQPIIDGNEARQQVVKLLCICPDGVPEALFKKHNISDKDRAAVVNKLLGTHVIRKIIGPTLTHYKDDLQAGDALIELLKVLRDQYNPASPETHRAAVRSFANFILPEIFTQTVGASFTGWGGLKKMEGDIEPIFQAALSGSSLRDYPDRTLTVHVGTEEFQEISGAYRESQLFTSFILNTQQDKHIPNTCDIHADKVCFHLNISEAIDKLEIPKDIGKLGDLFLPESVTPSLLLSMLDFFAQETTLAQIKELKQDAQVQLLETQIRNQLIGYFFSAEVKKSAVSQQADLAQVPAGKNFVERALGVLIRKKFKSYRAIAISHQWKKNLGIYMQVLRDAENLGVRRGEEPVEMIGRDVPRLFNVGQHTTFSNTFYPDGILRDLLLVNELDVNGKTVAEGVEVKNNQGSVAVYLKLHDMEKRILKRLEKSEESIVVDGKSTEAIKCHEIFQQEAKFGYLNDEIEELIKVLTARGLVDQKQQQGRDYLYCVETEINFAELQSKFQRLEEIEALAKSNGFTPEREGNNSLSSVGADLQTTGIEFDEVRKDSLRQKLNSIEHAFTTQCARWLDTEKQRANQKRHEIEPLRLDIPKVLDEKTGHPLTEFSTLLFNNIRSEVRKAYTAISDQVSALQNEVKNTLNGKLQKYYMEGRSSETAIDVAAQLRDFCGVIDTKIGVLRTSQKKAEQLYTFFEKWRTLARQIENDRQMMHDANSNDAINNLIGRLDTEQQQIKKHLANRTLSLSQVLENHEHFAKRFLEIKDEYDQITANRRDEFIKFQAEIEKELNELLEKPHIGEPYNPLDEDGSYRRVQEKVVERIQEFSEKAVKSVQAIMSDLMKPIEVFEVKPKVKNDAMALQEKLSALEIRISHIDRKLKPNGIEDQLSELVQSLLKMREEGTELVQQWEDIQGQLRCDKSELSPKARALLDLIEMDTDKDFTELIIDLRQSGNEMFGSTSEIIESLEELYQYNWLNIKISRTTA